MTDLRDEWGTPQWLFDRLHREFRFDLDAAATSGNAMLPAFLTADDGPPGGSGIASWPVGARVWLNPPYSADKLAAFLRRANFHARQGKGLVVVLLPARTDTRWWSRSVLWYASEVRFVEGRVAFVPPPGVDLGAAGNRPVFASVVAIYDERGGPPVLGETIVAPRNSALLVAGQKELLDAG